MKQLLLLIGIIATIDGQSQNGIDRGAVRITKPGVLVPPRITASKIPVPARQVKVLPQDRMPVIVVDLARFNMPNAWVGKMPSASAPGAVPNAAPPEPIDSKAFLDPLDPFKPIDPVTPTHPAPAAPVR